MQHYRRITLAERCQIFVYLETGISIKEIAESLGFHRSSIYREVRRHGGKNYQPDQAQAQSEKSLSRCRKKRKLADLEFKEYIIEELRFGLSPEQLVGRLRTLRTHSIVCLQTIYNEAKVDVNIAQHLRRFSKRRGRGRHGRRVKKRCESYRSIHERPAEINDRVHLGHWERDTMFVQDRQSLIVCLERKSRFIEIAKVKLPYAQNLTRQTMQILKDYLVLSFTNDNGNEFMDAKEIHVPVYYCDPHSPHQKGSIENAIGLLRQYIPRTTPIASLSEKKLKDIAARLNHRPRKCLDYKTPYEVMYGLTPVALAS